MQIVQVYQEPTESSRPALTAKVAADSVVTPLAIAFPEMLDGTVAMFVKVAEGWVRTIVDETCVLKWESPAETEHHASKFGSQTTHFQVGVLSVTVFSLVFDWFSLFFDCVSSGWSVMRRCMLGSAAMRSSVARGKVQSWR